MESLSVFDIFKIGVGPSSSHTMGPWLAALKFIESIDSNFDKIEVHLFGSLSKTGKGHGTDLAVMLGLEGYHPKTIDTALINTRVDEIITSKVIRIKDQEIDTYRQMALEQPNKNNHWWLAGGVVAGIGLSLGVFYTATNIAQ